MDQTTRFHVIKTLRVAAAQLLASVDAKEEFQKATQAMEKAIAAFKAKPTDTAYQNALESMKTFRKWAFEAYYKDDKGDTPSKQDKPAESRTGAPDRRAAPRQPVAASVKDDFRKAYDLWTATGNHRPLVAAVTGKVTASAVKPTAVSSAKKKPEFGADYKWFVVNKETGKIDSGWEYAEDAKDALKENNSGGGKGTFKIAARSRLDKDQLAAFLKRNK